MPAPPPAEQQRTLAALSVAALARLRVAWPKLPTGDPKALLAPLVDLLDALSGTYGSAAASLAADWYDEARADAGAAGRFSAVLAPEPSLARLESLAGWGTSPLTHGKPPEEALTALAGGLDRVVLNQARDTTAASVAADPAKPRYARHASANACAFCALTAARGAVYLAKASAERVTKGRGKRPLGEKYHDGCHCVAVADFGDFAEAPYVAKWRAAYSENRVFTERGVIDLNATLAEMRKTLGTN